MKGIVFTSLADMVETHHGIELWNLALKKAKVDSKGVYTSGKNYPDSELFSLVEVLQKELGLDTTVLVREFGKYLFNVLIEKHPHFYDSEPTFIGFLKSIKDVIHIEVKKLYENATVPHFSYEQESKNFIKLYYQSPRKLCYLAEGLIESAATKYQVEISLDHAKCMHDGCSRCEFIISVN